MDLGTVKYRLEVGQIKEINEFADLIRLTFQNAIKYNGMSRYRSAQLLQSFRNLHSFRAVNLKNPNIRTWKWSMFGLACIADSGLIFPWIGGAEVAVE